MKYRRLKYLLLAVWSLLTLWMVFRAQITGDQLNLLARGYLLATDGYLVPYGNPMSGGGKSPGSLTSILVGVPLMVWFHHAAPQLLLWAFGIGAFLILDRTLASMLTEGERLLFTALYLFTPAHLYFSVHLWNPHYLYILAAIHLWTLFRQKEQGNFWLSAVHVAVIGLAFQLHGSAIVLFLHSAVMLYARGVRFSFPGLLFGSFTILLTLVPWLRAVIEKPELLPSSMPGHFLGRGLVYLSPIYKGVLYSLRSPSFLPSERVYRFDFTSLFGAEAQDVLAPLVRVLGYGLGVPTVILSGYSFYWLYQVSRRSGLRGNNDWGVKAVICGHLAALITFALSPITITPWGVLILYHLLALRVVLAAREFPEKFIPNEGVIVTGGVLGLIVCFAVAVASPQYRRGGIGSMAIAMPGYHPMMDELRLREKFDVTVDPMSKREWIDILPKLPLPKESEG